MYYSFSEIGSIGHKEFGFKQNYFTCIWIKKSLVRQKEGRECTIINV